MKLSKRIEQMQFSPIRKLAVYSNEARARGLEVIGLNIGQPDIETPKVFFDAIRNYSAEVLAYGDSNGIPLLIDSFIEYYKKLGFLFNRNNILVTNGGSEALLFALLSICDVDDEIVIPEPFYTNYNGFGDMASVKVRPFRTYAEEGFRLPARNAIEQIITPKTKAILISNPGNPTGTVYTRDELRMLVDIAMEKNLYLISDEVYREFIYDNLSFTSLLDYKEAEDRVIIIDSISKRYSACGARIGALISKNQALIDNALKLCQSRLCTPTLEQIAAAALINTPENYFTEVKREYEKRRNILFDNLSKVPGIICKKPSGAFYVIAKLPVNDAEHFAKWLLTDFSVDNKTVMVAPAEGFYATPGAGKDEVRLSYCVNEEKLRQAIEIITKGLTEYKKLYS